MILERTSLVMQMLEPSLLITDDDRDFRLCLGEALARRGYRTILAADGIEALEVIRSQKIHLALLDVHMPRLDGLGMLQSLRDDCSTLPCILMSAELNESIVARARQLRTEQILAKPFSLHLLAGTIKSMLDLHYGPGCYGPGRDGPGRDGLDRDGRPI